MLKKITFAIIFVVLLVYLAFVIDNRTQTTTFGNSITLTDITPISQILENPQKFIGETVLVSGTINNVCQDRGCWIELASGSTFQSIRVKVKDGEIIFPTSAIGGTALVEGTVEQLVFTIEDIIKMGQHHAEEQGTEFDPATITKDETIYRIRGIGIVIDE